MNLFGYVVIAVLGVILVVQVVKLVKAIIDRKKKNKADIKEFIENETTKEDK